MFHQLNLFRVEKFVKFAYIRTITCFHLVLWGKELKYCFLGNRGRERQSMINCLSKLKIKIVSLLTSGWKERKWGEGGDEHTFSFIPYANQITFLHR
jgi:hypothetical protein